MFMSFEIFPPHFLISSLVQILLKIVINFVKGGVLYQFLCCQTVRLVSDTALLNITINIKIQKYITEAFPR